MRYFSTFSGIGGFELGIQNACNKLANETSRQTESDKDMRLRIRETIPTLSWNNSRVRDADEVGRGVLPTDNRWLRAVCVGYSEIDKYATKVYERNFNGHKNYGDITEINADELPDFDCLVGGFPCQAFSIAGKRKGFDDTRGTLFFDLARILRAKQPRLFVFENVKGLLSHDNGQTFATIISTLTELGYDCQWQVLNSKNHGVPQNRERIFIVGHLRGTSRPEVFPIGQCDPGSIKPNAEEAQAGIARTIDTRTGSYPKWGQYIKVAGTLDDGTWSKRNESIRRVYDTEGIAPTIPTGTGGGVMPKLLKDTKIRRLTPVECELLQGFPDNWTKFGVGDEPISDSQRYKMCGNAVTTNVIQAIFERIMA